MKTPVQGRSLADRIRSLSSPMAPLPTGVAPQLRELPEIRVVMFDVYGTLFVSASGEVGTAGTCEDAMALAAAMAASREGNHRYERRDEEVYRQAGSRGVELLHSVIAEHHRMCRSNGIRFPEVEIQSVWSEVVGRLKNEGVIESVDFRLDALAVEYECRVNPVWPMPGAKKLISTLQSAGVVLGIVSNAQFYTPLLFEALLDGEPAHIGFRSDLQVFSYQERIAKPSTKLLQIALDRVRCSLGIGSQEILYVGNDMRNDILPAWELQCRSALFAGDMRSYRPRTEDPRCRKVEPDLVITDLTQLIGVVT